MNAIKSSEQTSLLFLFFYYFDFFGLAECHITSGKFLIAPIDYYRGWKTISLLPQGNKRLRSTKTGTPLNFMGYKRKSLYDQS